MGLGLLGAFIFSVATLLRYVMTGWFFSVAAWGLVFIMVLQPLAEGWWSWIDCSFTHSPMFIVTAVSLTAPWSLRYDTTAIGWRLVIMNWLQFHSQLQCSLHYDTTAIGWRLVIMNWLQFHSQLQCSLQVMTIRRWSGTSSRCRVPLKIRFWPTLPGEKSTRFSGHQRSLTGSPSVTTTAWRSWEFDYDRESKKCEQHDRM